MSNDQSASAYRKAGLVMMFPTLRGGNTDTGDKEFFFGEVDDILAAAEHLAGLPYVDAAHIYLGGHSTGGTLALLTAEASTRFKAVFAFGAVSRIEPVSAPRSCPDSVLADHARTGCARPFTGWTASTTPTWLIEGAESPGNHEELDALCEHTRNPARALHCGAGIRSLQRARQGVARHRRAARPWPTRGIEFSLRPQEFQRASSN